MIRFLLSNEEEAKTLRKNFVFYIFPMLNPDGVIYGNHRCSLVGVDLNRRWMNPSKVLHPVIQKTKRFIKIIGEEREIS
jgi:murein tripeptide amidase MpaA